jgi:hypothetical protein
MEQEPFTNEENQSYIAFIRTRTKSDHKRNIKNIIAELQEFTEDAVSDAEKTTMLRNWVDAKEDGIG